MPTYTMEEVGTKYDQLVETGGVPDNIRDVVMGPHAGLVKANTYNQLGIKSEFQGIPLSELDTTELEKVADAAQRMATAMSGAKPDNTDTNLSYRDKIRYLDSRFTELAESGNIPNELKEIALGPYSHLVKIQTFGQMGFPAEHSEFRSILERQSITYNLDPKLKTPELEKVVAAAQRMAALIDPANYDPEI